MISVEVDAYIDFEYTPVRDMIKELTQVVEKYEALGFSNLYFQSNHNCGCYHSCNCSPRLVVYVRVSSSANKSNLVTQKERVVNYCNAKGYKVHKIIEEVGSGINDRRPKLEKLLKEDDYTMIVVEHKDRLTRFGFNYIETLLHTKNKKIEVINNVDTDQEDIVQDFVSIITSYCARIYGKRRSKRYTEKIIEELKSDNSLNSQEQ